MISLLSVLVLLPPLLSTYEAASRVPMTISRSEDRRRAQNLGVGTKIEPLLSFVRNVSSLVESGKAADCAMIPKFTHRVGS
jgi:hypothetical protein